MIIGIDASRGNKSNKSGVEWYSYHLIRNLFEIDDKNQFFLYTDKKLEPLLKPEKKNFHEKLLKWPGAKFWTLGRMSLEMVLNKPDVLFIPSHTFPFFGGRKNVITWHDLGYERYPETYTQWELSSLRQGANKAYKMADKIITVSHFTKQEIIERHNVDPDKIQVIYLGCDHNFWRQIQENIIKDYLSQKNIRLPYFIYVGRMSLRKNIVGLIRMYNRFREKVKNPHNLILVGDESAMHDEINDEIHLSRYKNEIKKMGWISMAELPILVNGARALVYPSIYEGFGLPTIEAMACGTPVIASSSGSLPEIVGEAGLIHDAHDINSFAEAMAKIDADESLRQALKAKGLIRAQQFTWEKCAKETLAVLTAV